jgi:ABC-2 type transport system permease protein
MRPILIALKEVRSYLKDRGDLVFSLLLPVILFALMYGAFGGQGLFHGTAYVVNEDGGTYAAQLIDALRANDNLAVTLLSADDADRQLASSDILLAVVIPSGFSASLSSGQSTQLVFQQRGNGGQEGQIVAGIVRGIAQEVARPLQVRSLVGSAVAGQGVPESLIQTTVQKYLDTTDKPLAIMVREQPVGDAPDPIREFLPGVLTMFILFSITLNARAIVEERKKGTLERLMTTRLSVTQLFTGKFLAGVLRGFVQSLILLVLSYIVFRLFTPLSFLVTLLIVLVFAAAASAVGLVIATVVRTEDAATWIAVFITMAMTMLGGTFFTMPGGSVWGTLSHMSINTYANTAINGVINGGGLADVWGKLAVMAGVAIVCLLLSRLLFRIMPGGR